ncbi:MAG: ATP phosphoribosyltransferase regulatory subunit [Alphaproteobacteria bacterium]|nr:ATP phosphoribosyltransferase regulatory subunit [Alphaproteobacteria bacterium]
MTDLERLALLPAGLRDVLPPDAAHEAAVVERLIGHLARRGYDRVKTPLIEFEDGLLSGAGAAVTHDTFRLMDPISQRMMGLRADITPQIARVALTRLAGAARPLRLSYAGEVLRVKGSQLRPERALPQVGAELVGAEGPSADAEIVVMAAEALRDAGIAGLTIDVTLPTFVPALCAGLGLGPEERVPLRRALDLKDSAAVAAAGGPAAAILAGLIRATGPAERTLAALGALALPSEAVVERERLAAVVARIRAAAPWLGLTIDPVENRGFEYHTGVAFAIFAAGVRGELGSGGRYIASFGAGGGEPATGVTLYVDTIFALLPAPAAPRRVYVPDGTGADQAAALRGAGWVTVAGLGPVADSRAEARRLGCSHTLIDGAPAPVAPNSRGRAHG